MTDCALITVCFGNHGMDYLGNPLTFQDIVRDALLTNAGKVGVFVEDVSIYPAQSEFVLQSTLTGGPLIVSFLQGQRLAAGGQCLQTLRSRKKSQRFGRTK